MVLRVSDDSSLEPEIDASVELVEEGAVSETVVGRFDEVTLDDEIVDGDLLLESVVFSPVVLDVVSVRRCVVSDTLREVRSLDVPVVVEVLGAD